MKLIYLFFTILYTFFSCSTDETNLPSDEPTQSALETVAETPRTWQYVENEQMFSRNGSNTGYLASINPTSNKLLVYFEGGGACYNEQTCNQNRNAFGSTEGASYANSLNNQPPSAFFDRTISINPYKDWNYIFIPYSTGDVHSGGNNDADVPNGGPQDQKMTGFDNFAVVAEELLAYFGDQGIEEFTVAGSSAGGYGTYLNFTQVAQRFPSAKMTGIVDAGPMFFTSTVFDDCLSNVWNNLFQFQYPSDYETVVTTTYDQKVQGIYEYLSKKYPEANFALLSDTKDEVIRWFFGFGANDCNGATAPISGDNFYAGLLDVEQHLNQFSNWHVYYAPGTSHTFLGNNRLTTTNVNGTNLAIWLEQVRAGTAQDVLP